MPFERYLHGSPREAVALLDDASAPCDRWVLGAALGALGRYGLSLRLLSDLAAEEPPEPYGSLACSTLGSHYRQLGRHDDALGWDTRALSRAGADPDAHFDAHLGLAADAVGRADLQVARSQLAAAEGFATGWRGQVRIGWVRTEIALIDGAPAVAVEAARAGLAVAREASAPRHVAKCLLFLGVSDHAAGGGSADELLGAAGVAAGGVGAAPLHWVAEAVLAERADQQGRAADAQAHRESAASTVVEIAASLDAPDRDRWLARPEFSALPL